MRPAELLSLLVLLGAGCAAGARKDDPLKNTKKLAAEGHVSLYKNGAFRVPHTSIALIPPGPSTLELVGQLMGVRARQSFVLSVERVAQSVTIVSEGTKRTYRAAKGVKAAGDADARLIDRFATGNGVLLVSRSSELGKRIVGKSWDLSKTVMASAGATGDAVAAVAAEAGKELGEAGPMGAEIAAGSRQAARDLSSGGLRRGGAAFRTGASRFVRGYAAMPSYLSARARDAGEQLTDSNFLGIAREENEKRARRSNQAVDLMSGAVADAPSAVSEDFRKARGEFEGNYRATGVSLAALKSMRWVLQGILGDAVIVPAAKATAASVGYLGVNLLAFPTMVVAREGVAATMLAVEVNWDAARGVYDLTAPTGEAAVAAVYGLADGLGSQALAGATAAGGAAAGYGEEALARTAEVVVKGAGYGAGKGVRYLGVPLAAAGIAVGGGTVGTVVGGVGAASGGALYVTGEAGSAAARGGGAVLAGAALAGGTSASAAGGAAYGIYELSKAVIVPPGYELAGGIVLDYGTLSHLSAQSILAVADCSYMVLSLEGPRWVLYAVKGKTGSGEDLPPGAIVDLKKMRDAGEEIYAVPETKEELSELVNSVYGDLPELRLLNATPASASAPSQ